MFLIPSIVAVEVPPTSYLLGGSVGTEVLAEVAVCVHKNLCVALPPMWLAPTGGKCSATMGRDSSIMLRTWI